MADVPVRDRRARRTRRNLGDALIALIVERGYDRITVQDVLDRADVGRSTFYAHFRDKDALFTSCFDSVREELREQLAAMPGGAAHADATRPVGVIFEHADRHRDI